MYGLLPSGCYWQDTEAASVPAEDSGCSSSPGLFSGGGPGGHPPSSSSAERATPADGAPPSPGRLQEVTPSSSSRHRNVLNVPRGDVKGGHTCLLLPGGAFSIAAGQDGLPVASGELAFRSEEARHEEVKQRPQLQDVVLRRDNTSNKGWESRGARRGRALRSPGWAFPTR